MDLAVKRASVGWGFNRPRAEPTVCGSVLYSTLRAVVLATSSLTLGPMVVAR